MFADLKLPVSLMDVARIVAEEYLAHEQHTLDKVAADLRARAELIRSSHGQAPDPLADAIWERCGRHQVPAVIVDDPRTIAQVAYEAVADLLSKPAAEVTGQDRTEPDVTSDPRTETNPHD